MYDYVIVTHLPAFYKVNLYNELAKRMKIFVIFIAAETVERRSQDFSKLSGASFSYRILYEGAFQRRSIVKSVLALRSCLKPLMFKKLIVGGWDLPEFWYLVFSSPQAKNCLALESTVIESSSAPAKKALKKLFLARISQVFASGELHKQLLAQLGYSGNIKITHGVGIINKPAVKSSNRLYERKFLFIGRLSAEKNLNLLLDVFARLQECALTIVGAGPDEDRLKAVATANVVFAGIVENSMLKNIFAENDFLILPSMSEPWGLVVEEALYFGLPVIVSNRCGASELVKKGENGWVFDPADPGQLKDLISNIDAEKYRNLLNALHHSSIAEKDQKQVAAYDL